MNRRTNLATEQNIPRKSVLRDLREGISVVDIAKAFNVDRNTIYNRLRKWRVQPKIERFNHSFFEYINNESKAYWLGFLMADGCVSVSQNPKVAIGLQSKDAQHLAEWHYAIQSHNRLCYKSNASVLSTHYSQKMCDDLIKLGCTPRKSLTLQFPSVLKHLEHHFVRGYFDGDGCASWHNKNNPTWQLRLSFVGTLNFLQKLQSIVGITNKFSPRGNAWAFAIGGNKQAKRVRDWMYQRRINIFG